uniref:Late blight resistance protein n=1 Tax=Solanum tuberosum TaxID=4113 RepID=M1CYK5_SOLTU
MVAKFVERSFQRHRVCSIPSSYELIFGSFYPILKEKELGFLRVKKRRTREKREEEEKKEESNKSRQDHHGFSSGVIPIKLLLVVGHDWAVYLSCDLLYVERLMILSVGWFIPPHQLVFNSKKRFILVVEVLGCVVEVLADLGQDLVVFFSGIHCMLRGL